MVDTVNQLKDESTEPVESGIRLIDADKVKVAIKEICDKYSISYGGCGGFGESIAKVIDLQPTVKATESKISKWNTFRVSGSVFPIQYVCIECNNLSPHAYDYCPYCGARMVLV